MLLCNVWMLLLYQIGRIIHWGGVTHICFSKQIIIGSDNSLSPSRRQVIIWTNAGKLLIGPLGTKFGEFLIEIYTFSFKKMHLKMSSGKWLPFCLALNVLNVMRNCPITWTRTCTHIYTRTKASTVFVCLVGWLVVLFCFVLFCFLWFFQIVFGFR